VALVVALQGMENATFWSCSRAMFLGVLAIAL